ncbi:MAG TPA: hypothetical protein VGB02_03015 [Pyrinomonadaceae bacterium]|jgi:hypothetical protein
METTSLEKTGHKILLISSNLSYSSIKEEIKRNDGEIFYYPSDKFGDVDRLINYTLCIVDYNAFSDHPSYRELFVKQMFEALEFGVNFCVVYYGNSIDSNALGTQILSDFKLGSPHSFSKPIHHGKAIKNEFNSFIRRWGSSAIVFKNVTQDSEIICKSDEALIGFSTPIKRAKIIYLPFFRNTSNKKDLKEGFETLIDSLLTYIARSHIDLPVWAGESSFFCDERILLDKKKNLQQDLNDIEAELETFIEAKSLLLHREYTLETTLPAFLQNHLALKIEREERYKEDFWLVNEDEEKIAIAEIKSAMKGFKRDMIFRVLDHKSENELTKEFPALLFINCNLQAGSWKDKDKSLSRDEYEYAARENVLIVRIEDVVKLWEMKKLEKIQEKDILELLLKNKGWFHITQKLEIDIKPKSKRN